MMSRGRLVVGIPFLFWVLMAVTIVVWALHPGYVVGWDLDVYHKAMLAVRSGHDPYLSCVAVRKTYFDHLAEHPSAPRPFGYVYPPITLPLLHALLKWPTAVLEAGYWMLDAAGIAGVLWVSTFAIRREEWKAFVFLVPAALFFPGLLESDPVFSGNVAYIVDGMIFAGALVGWRTARWRWFYGAVLVASLIKPTFLCYLGIPLLTATGQWAPALATAAVSGVVNLGQAWVWPVEFGRYRMSLQSQVVDYVHDFGVHPAGVLADALYDRVPFRLTFAVLYGVCAVLFGWMLLRLRGRFLRGEISLKEWVPVVLIGVTFLNPRIMQYDLLVVTVPMALVAWRVLHRVVKRRGKVIAAMSVGFVGLNVAANYGWAQTECLLLVAMLGAGSWMLWGPVRVRVRERARVRGMEDAVGV